jgi:hypothetical protein
VANVLRSGKWSKNYPQCQNCGTTSIEHRAYGLCNRCYLLFIFIIVISFLVSIPHVFAQVEIPYVEMWENIDDLNFNELQEKYRELFTFTKPFIVREGVKKLVIPTGVPDIYGKELGVAFVPEHADRMIMLLKQFEDDKLNEEQMASYMRIGMRTSCEYCCRVKTLVKPMSKGIRACGCAHSYAMRGLIKYLILNHSDKYTSQSLEDFILSKTVYTESYHVW